MRIVVVDDEKMVVESLRHILEYHGYEVFTAKSGSEGLLNIQQYKPDLVISDVDMPDMSGPEMLSQMHESILDEMPRYLLISSFSVESLESLPEEFTEEQYLQKPFDIRHLFYKINNMA